MEIIKPSKARTPVGVLPDAGTLNTLWKIAQKVCLLAQVCCCWVTAYVQMQ